jgi:hypothetical protein
MGNVLWFPSIHLVIEEAPTGLIFPQVVPAKIIEQRNNGSLLRFQHFHPEEALRS